MAERHSNDWMIARDAEWVTAHRPQCSRQQTKAISDRSGCQQRLRLPKMEAMFERCAAIKAHVSRRILRDVDWNLVARVEKRAANSMGYRQILKEDILVSATVTQLLHSFTIG